MKLSPGEKFGEWVVLGYSHTAVVGVRTKVEYYDCRCSCGRTFVVDNRNLRTGRSTACRSCGKTRHGCSRTSGHTRAYAAWRNMRQRCTRPTHPQYADYGGRGITVCERWASFENFLQDMGEPAAGLSLDRIDNDKGYSPENCRWATASVQASNKRKQLVAYRGQLYTRAELAAQLGVPYTTLCRWAASGDVEKCHDERKVI